VAASSLNKIPSFEKGDYSQGATSLTVTPLGCAPDASTAWSWLPPKGKGVVIFADRICRFEANLKPDLLLDAEVCEGSSTVVIRASGGGWLGWRWSESAGDSHRYVDHTFESSEHRDRHPYHRYRQYWHQVEEDGIAIWRPFGARFIGFKEEGK
jgi:hypothetical protein